MTKNPHVIIVCCLMLILCYSLFQGAFNLDPHHWGLMLSNAKDLYDQKLPYRDIFIQYGILTTIIQAAAYAIGKNLLSLIVVTSIFYSIGVVLVYLTALNVLKNQILALYTLITLTLFHPLAMYPWPNYVAFPFLVLGVYFLTREYTKYWYFFLGGLSFGMAVLAREGLFPAIALFIPLAFAYDLLRGKPLSQAIFRFLCTSVGCIVPIGIFFIYIFSNDLFPYWKKLAIILPSIYARDNFSHINFFVFDALLKSIYSGVTRGDIRWIIVLSILLINLYIFILALLRHARDYINDGIAMISLSCLLLISSSLDLAEIFRLATASSIGIISLYAFLQNKRKAKLFFTISSIWLCLTLTHGNRGNYFFPSWKTIQNGELVMTPEIFRGQFWDRNAINYYSSIMADLTKIKDLSCGVEHQYNNTRDSFFKVISPLAQLQIAPFVVSDAVSNLRPEINPHIEIVNAKKIAIIESILRKDLSTTKPPSNFVLYRTYSPPQQYFMPHEHVVVIYIPKTCFY